MTTSFVTLLSLLLAAALESGGDAAVRRGLGGGPAWLALGAVMLVAYGFVVNLNRAVDFGTLMGLYIAVFFAVSQVIAVVVVGTAPPPATLVGGAFIVAGGLIVQYGAR